MMLVTRLLPASVGAAGNTLTKGLENEAKTRWTPSIVTVLSDRAAIANNET
jgi:hypothetical protein